MYCTALKIASLSLIFAVLAKGQGDLQVGDIPLGSVFIKGESYNITYYPADNTSTLVVLIRGQPENFSDVATLSSAAVGGRVEWTPQEFLTPDNNYAIRISQDARSDLLSRLAWSPHFAIRDEASVLPSVSTLPLTSRTSEPPTPSGITSSPLPNSPSTGENITAASNARLGTEEIAGIAVGASIAGLALAISAFFIGRSFRRKLKPIKTDTKSWDIGSKPELDSKSIYRYEPPREMDARMEVRELHSDAVVGEVDANDASREWSTPQELHGESRQLENNSKSVA